MMSGFSMHQLALERVPFSLVISNPNIDDNPIVFVNAAFTALTGYSPEVSVGRNCRFLQGPDTDPEAIEEIRKGLKAQEEFSVELVNYKADGTPFRNRILISPLFGDDGDVQYLVGLQRAVGAKVAADPMSDGIDEALKEIHHRVKNHLSMVVGMIRMQARSNKLNSLENYQTLARRIETLQFLYQEMTTGGTTSVSDKTISLGAYVSRIASAIAYLDGREALRLNLDLAEAQAPVDTAAKVGLLVSELLTNAYQHAFAGRISGLIEVRLYVLTDGTVRVQVADDGVGLPTESRWPENGNLGGRIVRSLLTGLGANLGVAVGGRGCTFTIDIPPENMSENVALHPDTQVDGHGSSRIAAG